MNSHRRLFLLALIFLTNLICITSSQYHRLEKHYIVNKNDPDQGGCTPDQVEWLNEAFNEAILMVRGAMSDVRWVLEGQVAHDEEKDQRGSGAIDKVVAWARGKTKYDQNPRDKSYLRKTARLLQDLFGSKRDSRELVGDDGGISPLEGEAHRLARIHGKSSYASYHLPHQEWIGGF